MTAPVPSGIEHRVRKRAKRNRMKEALVLSAHLALLTGMAIAAPNALQLYTQVEKRLGPSPKLKQRMREAYSRLIAAGVFKRLPDGSLVLTEKGVELGEELALYEDLARHHPKKWDHKWRLIMFDVWERRRTARDSLRHTLQECGFQKLQDSVWVFPFPCEDLLVFLRKKFKLGPSIMYIVADEIERDGALRRHFKLPPAEN